MQNVHRKKNKFKSNISFPFKPPVTGGFYWYMHSNDKNGVHPFLTLGIDNDMVFSVFITTNFTRFKDNEDSYIYIDKDKDHYTSLNKNSFISIEEIKCHPINEIKTKYESNYASYKYIGEKIKKETMSKIFQLIENNITVQAKTKNIVRSFAYEYSKSV